MTLKEIEELLSIVTQNFHQAGFYEAMRRYGGIKITQEEIDGHEKHSLENRKQLIDAITQYGCEGAAEAFEMGRKAQIKELEDNKAEFANSWIVGNGVEI